MQMNGSVSDESASGYAASLPDRVTLKQVVRMIESDKIRGYQRGDEWFLDGQRAIQDSPNAPKFLRFGLFLLTANVLFLIAILVLGAAWSGFESAATSLFILGGAIGLVSSVVAVLTHLDVLGHRSSERTRLAEQGLELGKLGREQSLVAFLLGAFGLIFLAFYAGAFGVPGLIMLVLISALVFLML